MRHFVLAAAVLAMLASLANLAAPSKHGEVTTVTAPDSAVRATVDRYVRGLRTAKGDVQIANVDLTADVASAKVVETYEHETYVDYVNLVHVGAEWRIANAVSTHAAR